METNVDSEVAGTSGNLHGCDVAQGEVRAELGNHNVVEQVCNSQSTNEPHVIAACAVKEDAARWNCVFQAMVLPRLMRSILKMFVCGTVCVYSIL